MASYEIYYLPVLSLLFLGLGVLIFIHLGRSVENKEIEEGYFSNDDGYGALSTAEKDQALLNNHPVEFLKHKLTPPSFLESWFHTKGYGFRCRMSVVNGSLRWVLVKNGKKFRIPLSTLQTITSVDEEASIPDLDDSYVSKSLTIMIETQQASAFFEFDDDEEKVLFMNGLPKLDAISHI